MPPTLRCTHTFQVAFAWQVSRKQLNAEKPTTMETQRAWTSIEPDSAGNGFGSFRQTRSGLKYIATKQTHTKSRQGDFPIFSKIQCLILVSNTVRPCHGQQNVCGCIANSKIKQTAATWVSYDIVCTYLVQNTKLERHELSFCMSHRPWSLMSKWLRVRKNSSNSALCGDARGQSNKVPLLCRLLVVNGSSMLVTHCHCGTATSGTPQVHGVS